jgi:hypothetical protein
MDTETPHYLTREQAARRADVHIRTVARWLADGTLTKHVRRGSLHARVMVDVRELDRVTGRGLSVADDPGQTPADRASA